jgi:hypothetical protein
LMPAIGLVERECLNELQKHTSFKIIRNDSSFRYIVGRYPDGHILEIKLFLQYNEKHCHYKDKFCKIENKNTIQTTLDLASAGYLVFNISEFDWKNNKEKVVLDFKELIKQGELTCVEFLQPMLENRNLTLSI